jgi:hypothetical protein
LSLTAVELTLGSEKLAHLNEADRSWISTAISSPDLAEVPRLPFGRQFPHWREDLFQIIPLSS